MQHAATQHKSFFCLLLRVADLSSAIVGSWVTWRHHVFAMSPDTADLLSLLSLLISVCHCCKMSQGQSGLCWFVLQSDMTGPHSTAPLIRQGRDLHCSLAMEARRRGDILLTSSQVTRPVLMPTTCIGLGLVDGFTLTCCNNDYIGKDETGGKSK